MCSVLRQEGYQDALKWLISHVDDQTAGGGGGGGGGCAEKKKRK